MSDMPVQPAAADKLPTEAIIACHDELDLVPGKVRGERPSAGRSTGPGTVRRT
jgi:hypothetical protein